MHVGLGLWAGGFQGSRKQRWHHYSHVREPRCAHGGFADSRCWVRASCFLKYDPDEVHLFHRKLGQLTFDSENEQSGRYLCQTVWGLVRWEVAALEDVSSDFCTAVKESLLNQDCVVAEVQPRGCDDLLPCLDDDLSGGRQPPDHLHAARVFLHGQ